MRADKCVELIKDIKNLPYKAVLVSGEWGIGKSYAVDSALKKCNNKDSNSKDSNNEKADYSSVTVSLFALTKAEDIYHNLLFGIFGDSQGKTSKKLSQIIDKGLSVISKFSKKVEYAAEIKTALFSLISEKDLLENALTDSETTNIIVFDDLERLPQSISLAEILGIIEELKKINSVKIIIIANTEEIREKELFRSYAEKIIDREYKITELDSTIKWNKLGISDSEFVKKFVDDNKIQNLRTIKKAENFFEDVKKQCQITDYQFLKSVRSICYIVVCGLIEKEYTEAIQKLSLANQKFLISETFLPALMKNTWYSMSLYDLIKNYYEDSSLKDSKMFELEYDMFCKFQKKDLQYSSEKEIKEYLSNWRAVILQCRNPVELIRKADELIFWTEILSEATVDIVSIYSEQFEDLMWNYAKDNSWSLLSDSLFYGETKSKILLSASKKVISRLRERRIVEYIHEILTSDDIELKISCSRELKICFNDLEYKDIVIGNCKKLLVDDSFPLGSISAEQYLLCTNILYILKKALAEEYRSYVTGLLTRCDKMDKYRIEKIDKIIDQQI